MNTSIYPAGVSELSASDFAISKMNIRKPSSNS